MAASPRRIAPATLLVTSVAACGGSDGPDYTLRTPPAETAAPPASEPSPRAPSRAREPRPTQRDAERLRPVLSGWAAAVREGDAERAARYFAVPAIVAQSEAVELRTREQIRRFNERLPCGARLLEVQHDGRYVVGTFRLTEREGKACAAAGQLVRVAFVVRGRRFTEWRQVPDQPGAPPGPEEPEDAPPLGETAA